jgi:CheY-like chemotaxis protein
MSLLSALTNRELLIVSNDYSTLKTFISAWRETGSKLDSTPSIACARDLARSRKLHGIVIDMGVTGAEEFISQLQAGTGQQVPIILACVGTPNEEKAALAAGANFVVQKPISTGRVFDLLTLGGQVQAPQRRGFLRHRLVEPVTLLSDGLQFRALISDLSQSGMSIRSVQMLEPDAPLQFSFALRSTTAVTGEGRIMWTTGNGRAGIKFDSVRCSNSLPFTEWLDKHAVFLSC